MTVADHRNHESEHRRDPPRGSSLPPASAPRRARRTPAPRPSGSDGASSTTGGDIEEHALQHRGQVGDVDARRTDLQPERGGAVLEVGQRGCVRGAARRGRRAARGRPSRHRGPGAGPGREGPPPAPGVPSGGMSMPSSVECVSSPQTASSGSSSPRRRALRSTAAASLLPLRDGVLLPVGEEQVRFCAHARRIRTAEVTRPATVKYPTYDHRGEDDPRRRHRSAGPGARRPGAVARDVARPRADAVRDPGLRQAPGDHRRARRADRRGGRQLRGGRADHPDHRRG